jgi:apolipoprotein D and lipocalin family protein
MIPPRTATQLLTAALLSLTIAAPAMASDPPQVAQTTVASVDLTRYTGVWYEIARLPNRFQKQCVRNVTATYVLRDDGRIDVKNRCIDADGEATEAEGIARIVDTTSRSKLEVSFVRIFGLSIFWGDYWIIGLADDYRYAVIGTPSRSYAWILSRTPALTAADSARIDAILREQGYDPKALVTTRQDPK